LLQQHGGGGWGGGSYLDGCNAEVCEKCGHRWRPLVIRGSYGQWGGGRRGGGYDRGEVVGDGIGRW